MFRCAHLKFSRCAHGIALCLLNPHATLQCSPDAAT